jgi:hypothetical protein
MILKNVAEGDHLQELGVDENCSCRIGYESGYWNKMADYKAQIREYFNRVYSP